ncbi:helix-turn-helix domain-containing protein [Xanthocytophaga flava]|uniref:helix-turn-helix domain-containing protein n=1 Tax=Xanthocytophaga flava TaxID=3048013 RepID=UPI0028D09D6C|nr:helix-turn-helix domain-containing protein [Xanthocytophaga flavus]MDJ1471939.1 helix-turn-helix domain-containing protein [Xanthocytophaga flavus]
MKAKETIQDFYYQHHQDYTGIGQFNVYKREEFACQTTSLSPTRRDFYKISLVTKGEGLFSYADKSIHIHGNAITFLNPFTPYAWEPLTEDQTGYFCVFTEEFITNHLKIESLSQSPLFKIGSNPVLIPNTQSMQFLENIFASMHTEIQSAYVNKYDLLRSYVQIIIHEALKIHPAESYTHQGNAARRISSLFLELLERQFPIESIHHTIRLKNANEFADQLSIHTNHLNRALKETTGKTTTEWITDSLIKESKALLLHSSWDIAQIGYCLGFEHSSNFILFFKKHTHQTPNQFRQQQVVAIS